MAVLRSYYTISQDPHALNTWVQLKLVFFLTSISELSIIAGHAHASLDGCTVWPHSQATWEESMWPGNERYSSLLCQSTADVSSNTCVLCSGGGVVVTLYVPQSGPIQWLQRNQQCRWLQVKHVVLLY